MSLNTRQAVTSGDSQRLFSEELKLQRKGISIWNEYIEEAENKRERDEAEEAEGWWGEDGASRRRQGDKGEERQRYEGEDKLTRKMVIWTDQDFWGNTDKTTS